MLEMHGLNVLDSVVIEKKIGRGKSGMYQANNVEVPMLEMHGLNVLDSVVMEKKIWWRQKQLGWIKPKAEGAESIEQQVEQVVDWTDADGSKHNRNL